MINANEMAKISQKYEDIDTAARLFIDDVVSREIYRQANLGYYYVIIEHKLSNFVLDKVIEKLKELSYELEKVDIGDECYRPALKIKWSL